MKRIILGPGEDGKNTVLYEGDMVDVGKGTYFAWASEPGVQGTKDLVPELDVASYHLKPGESRFMVVEVEPGRSAPMHRTPYITDHLVAVSGELVMECEDGTEVVWKKGEMLVQLGGMHAWRNDGAEPFVMAGVIIGVEADVDAPYGVIVA